MKQQMAKKSVPTSLLHQHYPPEISLPGLAWAKLNSLRTGVGRFRATVDKWEMAFTPTCKSDAKEHSANHTITSSSIPFQTKQFRIKTLQDDQAVAWLSKKNTPASENIQYSTSVSYEEENSREIRFIKSLKLNFFIF